MVRYPFLTQKAKKYLAVIGNCVRRIHDGRGSKEIPTDGKGFENALYGNGKISSYDPQKISAEDILQYIGSQQKPEGLKGTAISHNITVSG